MSTTTPSTLPESDGFLELANLSWSASFHGPEAPLPELTQKLVAILAALLRAASGGVGALSLRHPAIQKDITEEVIAHIQASPLFFALENGRLMLPRYAQHAREIRGFFKERLEASGPALDAEQVCQALHALLPHKQEHDASTGKLLFDNAQQRLAIAALVDARVGVLTGGPGTGKTTTAAALLALLKRLRPGLAPESILVVAPTGKAACRIAEAIANAVGHLKGLSAEEQSFLRAIRSLTLHKALEWSPIPPEKGGPFQRGPTRPLEASLVLVDEASMVDLSLMHALVRALPRDANLLLLGDSDQLESVEVGGILSELVQHSAGAALPPALLQRLSTRLGLEAEQVQRIFEEGLPPGATPSATPLPGLVFGLKHSRRAMNAPWVLELAEHFRPGTKRPFAALDEIFTRSHQAMVWLKDKPARQRTLQCRQHWQPWVVSSKAWFTLHPESTDAELQAPLLLLRQFQLLCSTNAQVDRANHEGVALLSGHQRRTGALLPHGCPIIVQANNRTLSLSNGDVGIALAQKPDSPATLALFPSPEGKPRLIPLPQLPRHQPAFGLTIHKSQGSEWEHVAIELPGEADSSVLSKNLLYTAITRSSRQISIFGEEAVLRALLERP